MIKEIDRLSAGKAIVRVAPDRAGHQQEEEGEGERKKSTSWERTGEPSGQNGIRSFVGRRGGVGKYVGARGG